MAMVTGYGPIRRPTLQDGSQIRDVRRHPIWRYSTTNALSNAELYCVSPTSQQQVRGAIIMREKNKNKNTLIEKVGVAFIT